VTVPLFGLLTNVSLKNPPLLTLTWRPQLVPLLIRSATSDAPAMSMTAPGLASVRLLYTRRTAKLEPPVRFHVPSISGFPEVGCIVTPVAEIVSLSRIRK
jgi:hypothetical protein